MARAKKKTSSDELSELEQAVVRQNQEEAAKEIITKARIKLVLNPDKAMIFFATLACRLELKCSWDIPTMATDGRYLYYNPAFTIGLAFEEVVGVVVHEVLHCAMKHMCRRESRHPFKWNVACDLAINSIITDANLPSCKLPESGCFAGKGQFSSLAEGLPAEEYYNLLPEVQTIVAQFGDGDPMGCGGVMDAGGQPNQQQEPGQGDEAQAASMGAEWDVAVRQAKAVAESSGKGDMPGGLGRMIDQLLEPVVDWKSALREFVSSFAKNDYSWGHPNRRFVHQGIYLPSLRSEELGDVVIVMDTSGSIGQEELNRFASEAQGILEAYSCKATFILHHVDAYRTWEWTPQDGPVVVDGVVSGGTSHVDVFNKIDQMAPPSCVVCLTDMYSDFPPEPAYPVLWASTTKDAKAPWGRLVGVSL